MTDSQKETSGDSQKETSGDSQKETSGDRQPKGNIFLKEMCHTEYFGRTHFAGDTFSGGNIFVTEEFTLGKVD